MRCAMQPDGQGRFPTSPVQATVPFRAGRRVSMFIAGITGGAVRGGRGMGRKVDPPSIPPVRGDTGTLGAQASPPAPYT